MRTLNTLTVLTASLLLTVASASTGTSNQPNSSTDGTYVADNLTKADFNNWVCGTPDETKPIDRATRDLLDSLSAGVAIEGDDPADSISESHEPVIIVDFNNDSYINMSDLMIVLKYYGLCVSTTPCQGDVNGDGFVDKNDLLLLILHLD
jgi:hypothetical protein